MKIFSYIEKDAAVLLAVLILVISAFWYVITLQSEKSNTDVSQTVSTSEHVKGEQTSCSHPQCDPSGENTFSHSHGTDLTATTSVNTEAETNDLPWNSSSSEKGVPNGWKPAHKGRNMLLFAALSAVFVTVSFVSYYVPLRFFLKRAGYKVSSLKLYLQSFASMVIMAVMFSVVLILAGQLMFS